MKMSKYKYSVLWALSVPSQFTLLLKVAAIQAFVPASPFHTFTTAEAHFTEAYQGRRLGLIISNKRTIEEGRRQGGRNKREGALALLWIVLLNVLWRKEILPQRRGRQTARSEPGERKRRRRGRGGTCRGRVTPSRLPEQTSLAGCVANTHRLCTVTEDKVGAYPYISLSGDGFSCIQINHLWSPIWKSCVPVK